MPRPKTYADAAAKQRAYRARMEERSRTATTPPPATPGTIPPERRWQELRDQAHSTLDALRQSMQAYFDERSEAWQDSGKGEALSARIEAIEEALSQLQDA